MNGGKKDLRSDLPCDKYKAWMRGSGIEARIIHNERLMRSGIL